MNLTDDHDLELVEALNDALSAAEAELGAMAPPRTLADGARRAARRRTATRAMGAGLPVLAVAGVGIAILAGGRAAGHGPGGAPAGAAVSSTTLPAHDTAYIVRRVRARLAAASATDVIETTIPQIGGGEQFDWFYVDPQTSVQYQRALLTSASGAARIENDMSATPIDNVLHFHNVGLDYADHTYVEGSGVASSPMSHDGAPSHVGITSSPSQVQSALERGRVTQAGSSTVDGQPALVLRIKLPASATATQRLYVDAHTYQPLRFTTAAPGVQPLTQDWMPATPATIALARVHDPIPAGFTEQSPTSTH